MPPFFLHRAQGNIVFPEVVYWAELLEVRFPTHRAAQREGGSRLVVDSDGVEVVAVDLSLLRVLLEGLEEGFLAIEV